MSKHIITPSKDVATLKDLIYHRLHALFGLYVISHFVYRYLVFFTHMDSDMGFNYKLRNGNDEQNASFLILLLFLPHFALQMSGFLFTIPQNRHPDGNRIWPQYRFEALVFFSRSIALLLLAWYNKQRDYIPTSDNSYHHYHQTLDCSIAAFTIVILTMIASDYVTKRFRELGMASRTIRDLNAPKFLQYMMSSAQFHATLHSLMTSKSLSVQIAALSVVQVSAFGMTLRRKRIIAQSTGVLLYALILALGMIVIVHDLVINNVLEISITLGNMAAIVRFESGCNKYLLWSVIVIILKSTLIFQHEERQLIPNDKSMTRENWLIASLCSTILLILGAIKRHFIKNENETKKD